MEMRKVFLTQCIHSETDIRRVSYERYIRPRFIDYSNIHGFEFIEITENLAGVHGLMFSKFFWLQQNIHNMKDGDVVTYMDTDCCIMDGRVDAVFDSDFSIVMESCGLVCTGGTWSLRISDWSRKFVYELCNVNWLLTHKGTKLYRIWNDNLIIYYVLGLKWGQQEHMIGTSANSPFTSDELKEHVKILPATWGCTFQSDDVNFKNNESRRAYKPYRTVSNHVKPDRACSFDDIIVRHLSAGTMQYTWAERYYNTKMKV